MNNNSTTLITDRLPYSTKKLVINEKTITWLKFDSLPSTMDYAVTLAKTGCEPWTCVIADIQTSGRGTQGRTWFSPGGKGLWISLVLPPPKKAEQLNNLSVLTAEALIGSFEDFTELSFTMKHPNDVLIHGRKIAGILFESITSGVNVMSVVLGMGVNLQQTREDFESGDLAEATSFLLETGSVPDSESLLVSFFNHFMPVYEKSVLKSGE